MVTAALWGWPPNQSRFSSAPPTGQFSVGVNSYLHLARPDAPDGAGRDPLKLLAALGPIPPAPSIH
jgi:hypothetical protein